MKRASSSIKAERKNLQVTPLENLPHCAWRLQLFQTASGSARACASFDPRFSYVLSEMKIYTKLNTYFNSSYKNVRESGRRLAAATVAIVEGRDKNQFCALIGWCPQHADKRHSPAENIWQG